MVNNEYLDNLELKLTEILLNQISSKGFLDNQLLEAEELDEKWKEIAPEYMVDALPELKDYPSAAIAWASYIGMAMATMWDTNWEQMNEKTDIYSMLRQPRGFDEMDEYIMEEVVGLSIDSNDFISINDLLRGCAHSAMKLVRTEEITPQSTEAFYIFARIVKTFYRIGVSIQLKRLGYVYEKMEIEMPSPLVMS